MWMYRDFGRRLKAARSDAGMSQQKVADRVGLGRTSITNIESGKQHFPLHLLWDLASAVGVQPEYLLPQRDSEAASTVDDPPSRLSVDAASFAERVVLRASESKESG